MLHINCINIKQLTLDFFKILFSKQCEAYTRIRIKTIIIFLQRLESQIFVLQDQACMLICKNIICHIQKPYSSWIFSKTIPNHSLLWPKNYIRAVLNLLYAIIFLKCWNKKVCCCDIIHRTLIRWNGWRGFQRTNQSKLMGRSIRDIVCVAGRNTVYLG